MVEVRERISAYRFGPGSTPKSFAPPMVTHCPKLAALLPYDHIFIGRGSPSRPPSQWLDPAPLLSIPALSFQSYIEGRADYEEFLCPLLGRTLVCDCSRGVHCHGYALRDACAAWFGEEDIVEKKPKFDKFANVAEVIEEAGFVPAGRAAVGAVSSRVSAASQPHKQVLPQLIVDGLEPEDHLREALQVVHPFQRAPFVYEPIDYALQFCCMSPEETNKRRKDMSELIVELSVCVEAENIFIISKIHKHVQQVLTSGGLVKNIAAMRELQHVLNMILLQCHLF